MKLRPPRLPKTILDELEGLNWTLVSGKRHWRLMVDGCQIAVMSFNGFGYGDHGTTKITRAHVRRFKRRRESA